MAWKQIREPKRPTDKDVGRGRAYWVAALECAKQRLSDAQSSQEAGRAVARMYYAEQCLREIGE